MEKLTKVTFTNLAKVLYPAVGITKKDVVKYYLQVAPRMLPFLAGRALVVNRFPNGVDAEGFYGKDSPPGTPEWVKLYRTYSDSAGRELEYIVCDNLDTLLWLANLAALEMHIPLARTSSIDTPDFVIFDLDPQPPAGLSDAAEVARRLRGILSDHGLEGWVKTSGKRGLHIVVHVQPEHSFEETRRFAHGIGLELAGETKMVSSERGQKKAGTIYIDYPQNGHGRTMACPYSLRATAEAAVSTPLGWNELDGLVPSELNLRTVPSRPDSWQGFWDNPGRLSQG